MKKIIIALSVLVPFAFSMAQTEPASFVNPFIGNGGHGHTFPGAVLPFGMVQLSPDTRIDGSWDGCSGYHYSDSVIYGFSHTHLSGTGCSDWGDVLLMPYTGKVTVSNKDYASKFRHNQEKANAGFYSVKLDKDNIDVALTTTNRVGIHQYTYPQNTASAKVVLDLLHRDTYLEGNLIMIDSVTVVGYRVSYAWARQQHCFFAIKFSEPIKTCHSAFNGVFIDRTLKDKPNAMVFEFDLKGKPLLMKVGLSPSSADGALANINVEARHWDFDQYKKAAYDTWNKQLSKILITEPDKDKATIFYTALYHCFIHPSLSMDFDGFCWGQDGQRHIVSGYNYYTVFSLWDTYRALHPFFTIVERKRSVDFMKTFLEMFDQSKRLPVWELSGDETNCMIGYHAVSVISDAYVKGITDFDFNKAFEAMKATATSTGFGLPAYSKKNYLSSEDESESVSKTLEYAYDDWCIAQMAGKLGKTDDQKLYSKRAQAYKNLYNKQTGFMRPRKNGDWLSPFDPYEVNNHYTEGNSWQYSFYVPQDINGLIDLHGGALYFERKLDSLFKARTKTSGREQVDITGLIGQYAHGNEPSHHMAYLYNYVGRPDKTQAIVTRIMNEFYKNSPDGLIGNEDCGQMSAWYVMSALGFYPVCPGSTQYVIGKPLFSKATINLENGKVFTINNKTTGNKQEVISSVAINGTASFRSYIDHEQIMNGGEMIINYEPKLSPSNKFGKGADRPKTSINNGILVPSPIIHSKGIVFDNTQQITIEAPIKGVVKMVYTTDGKEPSKTSSVYTKPFIIQNTCNIKSKIYYLNDSSSVTEAIFKKRPNNFDIQLSSQYNKQYTAGGDKGLIDGLYGDLNWRKGDWQGYQGQDLTCVIDMKQNKDVQEVKINFLQDTRAWIIFPTRVEILYSIDGKTFQPFGTVLNDVNANDYEVQIKNFKYTAEHKINARYIKITAANYGKLPEWHLGKGGDAFIFSDEIEIK